LTKVRAASPADGAPLIIGADRAHHIELIKGRRERGLRQNGLRKKQRAGFAALC